MKRILVVVIILLGLSTLFFIKKEVSISFQRNSFHNEEVFDSLDFNIKNYNEDMIINIDGLDLLGFNSDEFSGYIKEFGYFTLVYKVYYNDLLVCVEYREINVYVYQSNINNLIINNNFNANLYKWELTDNTNELDYYFNNSELIITQNNTGNYFWDQKLSQKINLEYNETYKLSFDVYSTFDKQLEVSVYQELHDSPWSFNYGLLEYFVVNDSKNTYEFTFVCIKPNELEGFVIDNNNIKLEIKFGNNDYLNYQNSTIYFSNFSLIKM